MTIRNFVTGGFLTIDEMCETWGESLEGLNWSEKLWLIRGWTEALKSQTGISVDAEIAGGFCHKLSEKFLIDLLQGLTTYLFDPGQPISYYAVPFTEADKHWLGQAIETWGHFLDLGFEDHLHLITAASEAVIDNQSINQQEALKECLESGVEEFAHLTQAEVIHGLGVLATTQYIEQAMPWAG